MTLEWADKHSIKSDILETQKFTWINKDGDLVNMKSMSKDYLNNLIGYLESKANNHNKDDRYDKYFYKNKLKEAKEAKFYRENIG